MNRKYQNDLVSVIIPCYNSADYLPEAIESVLRQTYSNWEIIVIDDGSTDHTKAVLLPYIKKINYYKKKNGGPASARNYGIFKASGEYIAFLDADDYWLPEKLSVQINFFKKNPQVGLVHTNTYYLLNKKKIYRSYIKKQDSVYSFYKKLILANQISILTVVIKRDCIEKVGLFDESKAFFSVEDYDLWLRIAKYFRIGCVNDVLAVYRIHDHNISNEYRQIKGKFSILNKLSKDKNINKGLTQVIKKKRILLHYQLACFFMSKENYHDALLNFYKSKSCISLFVFSLFGIICCRLKTNVLFKDKCKGETYKKMAEYQGLLGNRESSKKYLSLSIMNYPFRLIFVKKIIELSCCRNKNPKF